MKGSKTNNQNLLHNKSNQTKKTPIFNPGARSQSSYQTSEHQKMQFENIKNW